MTWFDPKKLVLSRHFVDNWQRRMGTVPSESCIREIVGASVRVQPGRELYDGMGRPFRQLALYWDPALGVIIKIDEMRHTAVTVLAKDNGQVVRRLKSKRLARLDGCR